MFRRCGGAEADPGAGQGRDASGGSEMKKKKRRRSGRSRRLRKRQRQRRTPTMGCVVAHRRGRAQCCERAPWPRTCKTTTLDEPSKEHASQRACQPQTPSNLPFLPPGHARNRPANRATASPSRIPYTVRLARASSPQLATPSVNTAPSQPCPSAVAFIYTHLTLPSNYGSSQRIR